MLGRRIPAVQVAFAALLISSLPAAAVRRAPVQRPAAVQAADRAGGIVETWTLSERPVTSIGSIEGDNGQALHRVVGAVRLPDGRVAVLNAGSHQLRFYDAAGRHLKSVGRKGKGPGDFGVPARLYLTHPDSLLVYDSSRRADIRFDANGEFRWMAERPFPTRDGPWPGDVWLYGRNLIDGPRRVEDRAAIRTVLDMLPPLGSPVGFRYVRVDRLGRLWVRDEPSHAASPISWTVYLPDGSSRAHLVTPAGFEILEVGEDHVIGLVKDEMEVEYVRVHTIERAAGRTVTAPRAIVSASAAPSSSPRRPLDPAMRERMMKAIQKGMVAQEIFYSDPRNEYRYAADARQLDWRDGLESDLVPHVFWASDRGYVLLLFHESEPVACAVAIGASAPPGWVSGIAMCR